MNPSSVPRRGVATAASLVAFVFAILLIAIPGAAASDGVKEGFEERRDAALAQVDLEHFVPTPKASPLGQGRPAFTRAYGFSVANFALTAFWRNQQIERANSELRALLDYFINERDVRNDQDNFYWWTNELVRRD